MRKNWKKALSLVMAAAMTASLAACGGGAKKEEAPASQSTEAEKTETSAAETAAETTAEPAAAEGLTVNTTDSIEITFSWWGGDARHEATLKAVEAFMEKYPNITVKSSFPHIRPPVFPCFLL